MFNFSAIHLIHDPQGTIVTTSLLALSLPVNLLLFRPVFLIESPRKLGKVQILVH